MGIIGDAFKKLFGLLWEVIKWIGNLLYKLFKPVIDVFMTVVEVVFALVDSFLYFLYCCGLVIAKVFIVIFQAAKLLWSLVVGFGKTLASLTYVPGFKSAGTGYTEVVGKLFKIIEPMQMNSVAYLLLFIIWFTTAITAMKLISSIRIGGD
ncbi:hypothetical protein ACQKIY_31245 [Bacillus mycoides]|uniref:hypothetical protein n=1 Tax=Bacillus mycoides TaxID=1405 RepID=UPI003D04F19A